MKDFTLKDAEELILSGAGIGKDQAEALTSHSYAELASCADRIRKHFCGDKKAVNCEHYDISYTRSEVFNMLNSADESTKKSILSAVENVYKIKLAY